MRATVMAEKEAEAREKALRKAMRVAKRAPGVGENLVQSTGDAAAAAAAEADSQDVDCVVCEAKKTRIRPSV